MTVKDMHYYSLKLPRTRQSTDLADIQVLQPDIFMTDDRML